jgi:hypothetical protein
MLSSPHLPDAFVRDFESVDGSESVCKSKRNPTACRLKFDDAIPWKIIRLEVLCPRGHFHSSYKMPPISKLEDRKDLLPVMSSEAKWRELPDGTHVPFWVYHSEKSATGKADSVTEMEAFFFGFDTNPTIDDQLFNPARLTLEDWNRDFNVRDMEALCENEKRLYLRKGNPNR